MEKIIPGFEYYTINEFGEVFAIERYCERTDTKTYLQRRQLIKPVSNVLSGRLQICLRTSDRKRKTVFIHRLLALAFIPNPKAWPEINHINGISTDNRIENLEWCDRLHNARHAEKLGLKNHPKGENHPLYKDGLQKKDLSSYNKAYNRAKVRGINWKSLSTEQRLGLLNLPKLTKWDTKYLRNG